MVVELKFFLGLTDEEAADMLGMKLRTMQRMWRRGSGNGCTKHMDNPAMPNRAQ